MLLERLSSAGELVGGEALGDPAAARLYRWNDRAPAPATDGPYAEAEEHLAGFFLLDAEYATAATLRTSATCTEGGNVSAARCGRLTRLERSGAVAQPVRAGDS